MADTVNGLIVDHDAAPQHPRDNEGWTVAIYNRTRIEYRWDEDSGSFVVELPRMLTCAPTLADAVKSIRSIANFRAYVLRTGHVPTNEQWAELNKEDYPND